MNNLFSVSAMGSKPVIMNTGRAAFPGSGSDIVYVTVQHGLPNTPVWCDLIPALQSYNGQGWGAEFFLNEGPGGTWADNANMYFGAFAADGSTFGAGVSYFFNWVAFAPAK